MKEQITKKQLALIHERFVPYYKGFNRAMNRFDINTLERQCSFLAQIGHETGGLKWLTELWGPTEAQKGYEGRDDLGNTQPGDGFRYRGRGAIMYTGRYNYAVLSRKLEPNFVENPDLLAEDPWAILSAGIYWQSRDINDPADRRDHQEVTRRINGGLNGFDDRMQWYKRIQNILSSVEPATDIEIPSVSQPVKPERPEMQTFSLKDDAKTLAEIAIPDKDGWFRRNARAFWRTLTAQNKTGKRLSRWKDRLLSFVPYGKKINRWSDLIARTLRATSPHNHKKKENDMNWITERLQERSTWRGIIAATTALGVSLSPEQSAAIIGIGVAIFAAIEVFTKDAKNK